MQILVTNFIKSPEAGPSGLSLRIIQRIQCTHAFTYLEYFTQTSEPKTCMLNSRNIKKFLNVLRFSRCYIMYRHLPVL